MCLNIFFQLRTDVFVTIKWLITDLLDQGKPALKDVFIVTEVASFERKDNFNETVHQDGEEGNTENLNDGTKNFLRDWRRIVITVTNGRKCR